MVQIREIEHQWIEMSDGVRLSARLWLPELPPAERAHAILEYIPYRKRDMVRLRDQRNHPFFAQNGYASIRVDMRGSGDSEGSMGDMYAAEELDDAIEVIDWIARQSWCSGRVGMMGTSWGGTSSLQAASRRPESLKAVIAVCATNNRFDDDIHHMGGCLLTDTVEWGATLPAILASPPDAENVGSDWQQIWQQRLERLEFPLENWVRHETRDHYWRHGSVDQTPTDIRCPVLMVGGWADRYSNTVMNFLNAAHQQCWGIVGPWGHHYPDQASPGPGMGFQQEALRWWNHWLAGVDNKVDAEPRLRVWMQEYIEPENIIPVRPGRWISEENWPSKNIKNHNIYFEHNRLVNSKPLTVSTAMVPWSLTIGRMAGDTGYFGRLGGLPLDQQKDDELGLVFQSEPLVDSLEILGSTKLKVALTADQARAMLVVRLNDVHPDGTVARVCYAIRNLALDQNGEPIKETGENGSLSLELCFPNTAYRFEAGHQIRIAISSSYWPIVWPSPAATTLTLYLAGMELSLPVRKVSNVDAPVNVFESSDSDVSTTHRIVSAPGLERWIDVSQLPDNQSIRWHQPLYCIYFPEINLQFGFETEAMHNIEPPLPNSASSWFEHTLYFSRDEWSVKVISSAELRSTETHFKLQGDLMIVENEQVIFHREWNPVLPRTCS